jgi:cobalt/nickel transport system permease protein
MHMADALISPSVGGAMWTAATALIIYSSKKVKEEIDDKIIPLMGVMGAFIFAAQMINFTIPATGSSGHLSGGLLLAVILGPYAAFLTIASVLTIQALFFADGGLLALGANIFNLGFFPCFIAYTFIYKKITSGKTSRIRIITASLIAGITGLQLGAFSVVLETFFSGISELPFSTFIILMQPIHLAIGIVEGIATAAVVLFIWTNYPEINENLHQTITGKAISLKKILISMSIIAILAGSSMSWFASTHPDGLEWSIKKTSGLEELKSSESVLHSGLSFIQKHTAFLPDYDFKKTDTVEVKTDTAKWPEVSKGKSLSGLIGGLIIVLIIVIIGVILKKIKKPPNPPKVGLSKDNRN